MENSIESIHLHLQLLTTMHISRSKCHLRCNNINVRFLRFCRSCLKLTFSCFCFLFPRRLSHSSFVWLLESVFPLSTQQNHFLKESQNLQMSPPNFALLLWWCCRLMMSWRILTLFRNNDIRCCDAAFMKGKKEECLLTSRRVFLAFRPPWTSVRFSWSETQEDTESYWKIMPTIYSTK